MRSLMLLMALMLCVSALLIGCDQAMRQPITGTVTPPDMEIVTPIQSSLEKARAAMESVNKRRAEAYQKAEETWDFSTVFIASEDIFKEELGFRKGFWVDLVEIYHQENFKNAARLEELENLQEAFAEKIKAGTLGMFYFQYIGYFDEIIIEHLRLSFEFPEKSEQELLALFRESMRNQKIVVTFP